VKPCSRQSAEISHASAEPSAWVVRFAPLVPTGAPVLDLACGSGRHSRLFLERGHPVLAVDRDLSRLGDLAQEDHPGHPHLEALACDLENGTVPAFFQRRFGAVVVTNYLYRPLFKPLAAALAPGGILIYETFAKGNERFGKPSNPAFLLDEGELLHAFQDTLKVIAYEDVVVEAPRPAALQRLQQRVELVAGFQGEEIVAAADVAVVDEDLRHRGAPAAALDHLGAARGMHHHVDLREVDPLLFEQLLRPIAESAEHAGIDFDLHHN